MRGQPNNPDNIWKFIKFPKEPDGCWIWTGTSIYSGYGRIKFNSRNILAHRFVYEYLVDEIPKGLTLDHLCRNRICVNPDHLETITQKENRRRGQSKNGNMNKTHCIHGHKYTKETTQVYSNGWRECKICKSFTNRRNYLKKKLLVQNVMRVRK